MTAQPFVCVKCGQRGDEPPGLKIVGGLPEAIFVDDGGFLVDNIECNRCGHVHLVAAGSVEVKKA